MKTLITFLGKSFHKENGEYSELIYDFNGEKIKTKYFALALAEKLGIEKLIVLGTSGSGWNNFYIYQDILNLELAEELENKVADNSVSQFFLDKITKDIKTFYSFKEIKLKLIPYCETKDEQYELFETVSEEVTAGDELYIDLTHGFRYMAFFAFTASLYLKDIKKFNLKNVFCGTETGKVIELTEMLNVVDWVKAFSVYENSGNYGVFSSLFNKLEIKGSELKKAAFFERTFNLNEARSRLSKIKNVTDMSDNKLLRLFKDILFDRISWYKEDRAYKRERELAKRYFDSRDYIRCATFLFESVISEKTKNSFDYNARKNYERENTDEDFEILRVLRNQLAHGVREEKKNRYTKKAKEYIEDEDELRNFLLKFL